MGDIQDIYDEYEKLLKDDARLNKKKQETEDEITAESLTSIRRDINNNRIGTSTKTDDGILRRKVLLEDQVGVCRLET